MLYFLGDLLRCLFFVAMLVVLGYPFYKENIANRTMKCDEDTYILERNLTDWMQEKLPRGYTISVMDVHDFYELKSSPVVLGTTLYEDIKGSQICRATARIQIKDDSGKVIDDEVSVRYQYSSPMQKSSYIYKTNTQMCGHDVKQLRDDLHEIIIKNFE